MGAMKGARAKDSVHAFALQYQSLGNIMFAIANSGQK